MFGNIKQQLIDNKKYIAIWGLGYLGYSNILHYVCKGIKVIATDFGDNRDRLSYFEKHKYPGKKLYGIFSHTKFPDIAFKNIEFEHDPKNILGQSNIAAHLLCIPGSITKHTIGEKREFFTEFMIEQKNAFKGKNILFIIESLMPPGATYSDIIEPLCINGLKLDEDFNVCVAPRRDWSIKGAEKFSSRLISGTSKEAIKNSKLILSLVTQKIEEVPTISEVELAANIENSLQHLLTTYINQITLAYPDIDIRDLMNKLSSITENDYMFPSLGAGGLRIPVSSMNIIEGTTLQENLTLLKETVFTDFSMHEQAVFFIQSRKPGRVAILGLSYKIDEADGEYSPVFKIIETLQKSNVKLQINDPNFSDKRIKDLTGCAPFAFPEELEKFDLILLFTGHTEYKSVSWESLERFCRAKWILDNTDLWNSFDWETTGIEYKSVGRAKWLD